MRMTHLSHGFYMIDKGDAKRLNGGRLPSPGKEALVEHDGKNWWLARTPHGEGFVWSIRETDWRMADGRAVLGPSQ